MNLYIHQRSEDLKLDLPKKAIQNVLSAQRVCRKVGTDSKAVLEGRETRDTRMGFGAAAGIKFLIVEI